MDTIRATEYIDAFDLARTERQIQGHVNLSDMPRLQDQLRSSDGEIAFRIRGMTGSKGWPGAVMWLTGTLPLICNRCRAPLNMPLETETAFRFAHSEAEADAIPIEEDDEAEVIVGSTHLNLLEWIEEELILTIPLVPVHEEGCPNVKKPQEAPSQEQKRRPFAALGELLKKH